MRTKPRFDKTIDTFYYKIELRDDDVYCMQISNPYSSEYMHWEIFDLNWNTEDFYIDILTNDEYFIDAL